MATILCYFATLLQCFYLLLVAVPTTIVRKFYHHIKGTNYYAEHNITIGGSATTAQRYIHKTYYL